MGSFLVKLLTNPENFKFYSGNSEGQAGNASSANGFGQKSIPFGKDRPGGGNSNQPYIKGPGLTSTGIQTVGNAWSNTLNAWSQPGLLPINAAFFKPTNGVGWAGLAQNTLNQFTSLGPLASSLVYAVDNLPNIPDSIIRGGTKSIPRSVIDATRLTKYFLDYKSVNGILFLAKQNLLSRVAVKTEPARTSAAYLYGVLNGGVYTPLSTIGQAATGFAGIHLNDKGIDPTGIIPQLSIRNYQEIAFNRNKNDISSENSKGYQTRVQKKINKINRLKYQLENSKRGFESNKVISNDIKATNLQILYNGKIYNTHYGAALAQVTNTSSPSNPASLQLINQGEITDFSFLNPSEQKLLNQAKKKDQEWTKEIEKATKENEKQQAENEKQIKKLPELIQETEEELEELTLGGDYKNRLLRLWNKFGLDINNPVNSDKTTLLSYGGGPGSILGIGKTKIKFATLNDGITPARTGFNMQDPYADSGYLNESSNNPIRYAASYLFGYNKSENSILYRSIYEGIVTGPAEYFGDTDYLGRLEATSKLAESNSNYLQKGWASKASGTDPANTQKKYSAWDNFLFNIQPKNTNKETLEDFRTILKPENGYTFLSLSPNYTVQNIERRLNIGKRSGGPGASGILTSYTEGKKDRFGNPLGPVDDINATPIYRSEINNLLPSDLINDIIPFRISIMDNNKPDKFFHIHLRAFIDDFSDGYKANWKKIEYMGRGEKFLKYGGFDRDISFSFTVAAQSKEELVPIYRKLNFLASSLSPFYSNKGYMGGNIAHVTLGDYLKNQPGVIESMEITVDKESPWEIAIDTAGDPLVDMPELPFIVKVSVKFTPIHNFRPEIQDLSFLGIAGDPNIKYGNQRYISTTAASYNPLYYPTSDSSYDPNNSAAPIDQQEFWVNLPEDQRNPFETLVEDDSTFYFNSQQSAQPGVIQPPPTATPFQENILFPQPSNPLQ